MSRPAFNDFIPHSSTNDIMSDTRASHSIRFLRATLFGLVMLAACESAESKRMKTLAGDYVYEYASDTIPGQEPMAKGSNILTLRPDGKYLYKQVSQMGAEPEHVFVDSGAYRINGTTLVTGRTEEMPSQQYTISGDTLWANTSRQIAQTEAVTGIKFNTDNEQPKMVRRR
jgi:hypothetical protein